MLIVCPFCKSEFIDDELLNKTKCPICEKNIKKFIGALDDFLDDYNDNIIDFSLKRMFTEKK